jgi:hypothetical protein
MAMTGARAPVLTRRELNRALLARQLLLEPARLSPATAVTRLVGLQAQAPLPPYLALRARLRGFDPGELGRMLTDAEVVRLTLLRGTIHMVTPYDAAFLRPLVQPVIERTHAGAFGRRMGAATPEQIAAATLEELRGGPLGARELGRRLVARGIGDDVEAIGNATRVHVPLVQLPPRGVWGAGGQVRYQVFDDWTGQGLHPSPSMEALVLRYLAAFGPATAKDMQTWSGLTGLAPVFDRLRDDLLTFRDEDGRELFDLPDAPRPDPDAPAGVRFLGEYDNLLLGHHDRRRIIPQNFPWKELVTGDRFVNHLLVDGMLRGVWWIERDRKRSATLVVEPAHSLTPLERQAVEAEAHVTLRFLDPPVERHDVRLEPPTQTG